MKHSEDKERYRKSENDLKRARIEKRGSALRRTLMSERGIRKTKVGIVVSDKMDKTIVVQIVRKAKHPLYGKTVKITKKYKAHDENNTAKIGDKVMITETRR
jgi:small subunit ribosomal protein S17